MLSYAEHGKFPAATQGQSPREREEKVQKRTDPTRMTCQRSATVSGSWEYDKRNGPPQVRVALDGDIRT
jgi:hypothetical protein